MLHGQELVLTLCSHKDNNLLLIDISNIIQVLFMFWLRPALNLMATDFKIKATNMFEQKVKKRNLRGYRGSLTFKVYGKSILGHP